MQYKITDLLSISVDDKNTSPKSEIACLLSLMCGLSHVPDLSKGAANVFKGDDGTLYWIAKTNIAGEDVDFSDYADMQQLAPHKNFALCQTLARKLGLIISGEPYEGGMLAALWKVEYVTGYGVTKFAENGWTYGANEPVMEKSSNLPEAICRAALRVAGVGRKAYLLTREGNPEQQLIFMSDWVFQWVSQNTPDAEFLVRVPELDMYAISGIDENDAEQLISDALAKNALPVAETKADPALPDTNATSAIDQDPTAATIPEAV